MKKHLPIVLLLAALFTSQATKAQSLKDLFNSSTVETIVSAVTGSSTSTSLEGTWTYTGAAVDFESDNLLTKAGGTVAASTIESSLDTQLEKLGITDGSLTFTFASDSTFTTKLSSKTVSGTYSYDTSAEQVSLKFAKVATVKAYVNLTSSSLDLLFDADKLLTVISAIASKTNNSTLSTISSLADSYDGVQLGFALSKED